MQYRKILVLIFLFSCFFSGQINASGIATLSATYSDRKEYIYPSLGFSVNEKISKNVFGIAYLSGSFSDNDYPQSPETRYYYSAYTGAGYEFNKKFNLTLAVGFSRDQNEITQGILKLSASYKLW